MHYPDACVCGGIMKSVIVFHKYVVSLNVFFLCFFFVGISNPIPYLYSFTRSLSLFLTFYCPFHRRIDWFSAAHIRASATHLLWNRCENRFEKATVEKRRKGRRKKERELDIISFLLLLLEENERRIEWGRENKQQQNKWNMKEWREG